ncbi:ankyrin repeat-containing domain protein [Chaetomium sp. MPI-CAGE-AT-0009]|nr:ankyrin repeat-containing domain protein [Chaetomium sp. MPI-CAGE-AT-0009]
MWEDLYVRRYEAKPGTQESSPASHAEYKNALEELYRSILKYQVTAYEYYSRSSAFRIGLDMIIWDDWETLLDEIREQERVFTVVSAIWRDMKYDEECEAAERRHVASTRRWEAIGSEVEGLRQAVEAAQEDRKRVALLDWLCDVDPSVIYNTAREKHEGATGEWLLYDSKEFWAWQESPGSLLWLHGKAGSGKTILSSSVIEYLRDQYESDPETALAYFYFSFTDTKKQNVPAMLASLVKQLCSRRPDTPQPIKDLARYKERGERPNTPMLEAALTATMRGFSTVHIVIDGLDECPDLNRERKKLLDSLRRIVTTAPDSVHVFCTSRREPDIDAAMSHLLCPPERQAIDLTTYRDQLDQDIGYYIDSTLESDEYSSWPESVKAEVRDKLIEKADGMIQYVSCQFEELRRFSSVALVRKALQDLPVGLDATYDRMLQNLDPNFQPQIISMLKWLCFADRALTLYELAEIFVLRPQEEVILDKSERLFNARDVLKYLGSFVVVFASTHLQNIAAWTSAPPTKWYGAQTVTLAHFSIKEYLTSQRISQGAAAFSFSEVEARFYIAHSCLAYTLDVVCAEGKRMPYRYRQRNPLTDCAATEWIKQLEMLPITFQGWPGEVFDAVQRALRPRSVSLLHITDAHRPGDEEDRDMMFGHGWDASAVEPQPHLLSSWLGSRQLTDMAISTSEYLTQDDLDAALHQAVERGAKGVVELLLDRGADVNGKDGQLQQPILRAVQRRDEDLVRLLVQRGADVNPPSGSTESALKTAARGGQLQTVKFLIEQGADICNADICTVVAATAQTHSPDVLDYLLDHVVDTKCTHSTALHKAIYWGSAFQWPGGTEPPVNLALLLERGFDVNSYGGEKHGYPLHVACRGRSSRFGTVGFLLARGADINAAGGESGTALQVACVDNTDIELVKRLLEQGADVNAQAGKYGTALQAACYLSSNSFVGSKVVRLLLEHGADINAPGGLYGSALHAAAAGGDSAGVVALLVGRGAHVHYRAGKYETVLQAAAVGGDLANLSLLIAHGAEINTEGGQFGTALQAACVPVGFGRFSRNRVPIDDLEAVTARAYDALMGSSRPDSKPGAVHLLIDAGANVHIYGGAFGSAWHAAAVARTQYDEWKELLELLLNQGVDINDARGRPEDAATALHAVLYNLDTSWEASERMDFLLSRGANPNLKAGIFGYPLQAACAAFFVPGRYTDAETRVKDFLERCPDVDVDAPGGLYGSALQAAAYSGQTGTIRLLLEKGADPDLRGGKYRSALNAAVFKAYWDIVEILLEAGARPDCWDLLEPDEEWLEQVRKEDRRGAVERYRKFWEKQMERRR